MIVERVNATVESQFKLKLTQHNYIIYLASGPTRSMTMNQASEPCNKLNPTSNTLK